MLRRGRADFTMRTGRLSAVVSDVAVLRLEDYTDPAKLALPERENEYAFDVLDLGLLHRTLGAIRAHAAARYAGWS